MVMLECKIKNELNANHTNECFCVLANQRHQSLKILKSHLIREEVWFRR